MIKLNPSALDRIAACPGSYPGAHCKYCRALGTERCPESQEIARLVSTVKVSEIMPTGEDLALWLDRCALSCKVADALRVHARAELKAGRAVPGWTLCDGKKVRHVKDLNLAWQQLEKFIRQDDFVACCNATVGRLEDAFAAATGETGEALRNTFNAFMGPSLEWVEQEPCLKRVK